MEIKVLPTRKFFEKDIQYIKERLHPGCELLMPDSYAESDLIKLAAQADIFLGPVISKALCKAAPKLQFIQVPWTGVDNLDFSLIAELGIKVCNSHSNAYAVAEHAIALMLDVAKKIAYHDAELRKGNWNRPKPDSSNEITPFSKRISNSNIGIIGYGHIGKTIHKFLSGFGCAFFVIDASVKTNYSNDDTHFFPISETLELLKQLDVLFICVPLTASTRKLVSPNFLNRMNKTAILINTSRGEVIDENALFTSLNTHQLAGAGIDTWYNYPKNQNEPTYPSVNNPFHELKNIVLSPHRSAMIDGELPHLDDAIININRAAKGLEPLNAISTVTTY